MSIEITKDEFFVGLRYVTSTIIIPAFAYMIRKINSIDAKINAQDVKIAEINTTLVGQDGKNGLRSKVSDLQSRFEDYIMGLVRVGVPVRGRPREEDGKDA